MHQSAITLTRPLEQQVALFLRSTSFRDVADVMEVKPGHLKHWLYYVPSAAGYKTFEIPKKSGGSRAIAKPPPQIGILQLKAKQILDEIYVPKRCVSGFVRERSVITGASEHARKAKWVLNFDLEDFFGSITSRRLIGLFKKLGLGKAAAATWAQLFTYQGKLPQGACTSPVLSNMILQSFDGKMLNIARRFHLRYTRYADDITLSTTKVAFPRELATSNGTGLNPGNVELGKQLLNAVSTSGFTIQPTKTRLLSRSVRQEVTGLTVNEFVNVRRSFIRQLRSMIHAVETKGLESAAQNFFSRRAHIDDDPKLVDRFERILYGKLAYLRMVRGSTDTIFIRLSLRLSEVVESPPEFIKNVKIMHEEHDVFICHASEDKEQIAIPLNNALKTRDVKTFLDSDQISWGDSFVEKINHALSRAKIVVVILSKNSVDKHWPRQELHSALARQIEGRTKILLLMVGSDLEIQSFRNSVPLLADKLDMTWKNNPDDLASSIAKILGQ